MSIGKLVVSHGNLALELVSAAEEIAGEPTGVEALALDWQAGCDEAADLIRQRVVELDRGEGVIILTDMFGDTPCNAARRCHQPGRVEVVTGVNLPMVVRLACTPEGNLAVDELAEKVLERGQRSMQRLSAVVDGDVAGQAS